MYQNSEVNQELRDRLPRANKTDPLKKGKETHDISESSKSDPFKKETEVQDTEESSIEEQIVVEVNEKTMMRYLICFIWNFYGQVKING